MKHETKKEELMKWEKPTIRSMDECDLLQQISVKAATLKHGSSHSDGWF